MEKEKEISLPLIETLKRSFLYFYQNFYEFLKIISIGIIFVILFDVSIFFQKNTWQINLLKNLINAMSIFLNVYILVSGCRLVLLKEKYKFWGFRFGNREIKFLSYILLIMAISMAVLLLCIGILSPFWGSVKQISLLNFVVIMSFLLAFSVGVRLVLLLPAIAIDNHKFTIKDSIRITKGNVIKIMSGIILIEFLGVLFYLPMFFLANLSFVFMLIYFAILPFSIICISALKSVFYAHIYQYLTYYDNRQD